MIAAVQTADGVYFVDLETDDIIASDPTESVAAAPTIETGLPRVLAAARSGSTVVAVVDRRPPVVVSHDAGRTWKESGGGLPPGVAVAVWEDNPDVVLYAARNRLFLSRDGGRFWQALSPELPEIQAVELTS